MIKSMTGYGDAQGQLNGVTYIVEVKTVNNRYFKTRIKLPDSVAFLEEEIEKLLQQGLSRGTINYTLRLKDISAAVLFDIDEAALRSYVERLSKIAASVDVQAPIDIGGLLSLPGIIQPVLPDEKHAGQIKQVVLEVSQKAIDHLKQMRATEGAALVADLETNCQAMKESLEHIRSRSQTVLLEYHEKLKKRVESLLAKGEVNLDETTIAREVAVFAERSDISEEVSRLDSHLQQFAECCNANAQSAGRRLDFISQEMLREANTIASKASDAEIAHCVVDLKCHIDRIKEQVQNIE